MSGKSTGSGLFVPASITSCPAARTASITVCLSGKPAWSHPTTIFIDTSFRQPIGSNQLANSYYKHQRANDECNGTCRTVTQQNVEHFARMTDDAPVQGS